MAAESRPGFGAIVHHAPAAERWRGAIRGAVVGAAIAAALAAVEATVVPGDTSIALNGIIPAAVMGWLLGPRASRQAGGDAGLTVAAMAGGTVLVADALVTLTLAAEAVIHGSSDATALLVGVPLLFLFGLAYIGWWMLAITAPAAIVWWALVHLWSRMGWRGLRWIG